nr:23S rRNA (uracil(1939)-C(5))-methyltransferase RlmD [Lachnospiraceae bacterium]
MKKNDEFELQITDMSTDGEGIGHADGMTFFVKGAAVGDTIIAGVTKLKKTYGYARIVRMIKPSPDRTEPVCPIASRCGGCTLQHISYDAQLKLKEKKVRDALVRIGGTDPARIVDDAGFDADSGIGNEESNAGNIEFKKIIGMEKPLNYRNKGQFPVGTDKNGNVICGFYATHSHDIVDTASCPLQHPITDLLIAAVKKYMGECGVDAYREPAANEAEASSEGGRIYAGGVSSRGEKMPDNKKQERPEKRKNGIIRHVLTRVGFTTHEVMVCVVIAADELPQPSSLISHLDRAVADYNLKNDSDYCLGSVSFNINKENTNVILGNKVVTVAGLPFITDYIGNTQYRISPLSFYQVNPVQTLELYATALEFADPGENDTVWDLYCGIGTISLYFAPFVKRVYGIEIVPQAIADAKENAKLNGITDAEFYCGAAEDLFPELMRDSGKSSPDIVVVDPPRKGCDASLIECIGTLAPRKIVYVSCDPATLARDIKLLRGYGYEVRKVQPVDMFPQTMHVETVCLLSKLSEAKHHIEVKVDMDELDLTSAEAKATYKEIQDWVQEKYGFHVTNLNIAQVKQKHGIIERENYNKPK